MNLNENLKVTNINNDLEVQGIIQNDKDHVWHHLTQHKPLEQNDPLMIVEGNGMRVTDAKGKEYLEATSGGVWTVNVGYPPEGYWETIQEICKKYDILLHIDEVVCGLGRTGTWFGYQHYDIKPHIVTLAKGLASGYAAISCTVTTEEVFEAFKQDPSDRMSYFRDISTFGGCGAGKHAHYRRRKAVGKCDPTRRLFARGMILTRLLEHWIARLNSSRKKRGQRAA